MVLGTSLTAVWVVAVTVSVFCLVLHAEANAITKVAKSHNSSEGATLYVTSSPCLECSKLIIQAGIHRVVFSEPYHLNDGIELLERAGIEVVKINMEEIKQLLKNLV